MRETLRLNLFNTVKFSDTVSAQTLGEVGPLDVETKYEKCGFVYKSDIVCSVTNLISSYLTGWPWLRRKIVL